jgi:hypothetical protein
MNNEQEADFDWIFTYSFYKYCIKHTLQMKEAFFFCHGGDPRDRGYFALSI